MSDRDLQSYQDCDGTDGQSVHSFQSVWMARWTQTSCNVVPQTHSRSSHPCSIREVDHTVKHHVLSEVEIASDISRAAKGFKEVEARTFGVMNESLTMSSENSRNENLGVDLSLNSWSLPSNDKDTSHMQGLRSQFDHKIRYRTKDLSTRSPSVLAMASPATDASAGECHIQPEVLSQNPMERENSHIVLANNSLALSGPLENDFIGPTSHTVPHKFERGPYKIDSGGTAVTSFRHRPEEKLSTEHLSNTNLTILKQEHRNCHEDSTFMFPEKKIDNCLNHGKSATRHVRQNKTTLSPIAPLMSNYRSSVFGGEQYQSHCSGKLLPSPSCTPKMTKLEKLYHGHSMEGLTDVPPRFSETTRSFLITKETDVNLLEENQIFRESRVSTRLDGNTSGGTRGHFPLFGYGQQGVKLQPLCTDSEEENVKDVRYGQQRVKLQPLGSSTDSEEENVEDVKAFEVPKNASSAETDTMEIDSLKENSFSGVKSSPSNKVIAVDLKFPTQAAVASAREKVADRRLMTELPDINVELPALPDGVSSMNNADPSTSRTQSLDMELAVAPSDQLSNSKSIHSPDDPMGPDPCSRWIKRLKVNASNTKSFVGTTSSSLGEASTHKKVSKFFEIMKGSINSISAPTLGKHHVKKVVVDVDSAKKDGNITLSHAWIRRWRHNDQPATQQKKPEAVVICEPERSNLEDFQKKQFPSTAAMALMGKAMTGFRPCEFRKRGSFVVWNTKGF
ncbi:hypothetical protein LguiB_022260 [Lonicera macranthoides]